jgi:hypothetical protein
MFPRDSLAIPVGSAALLSITHPLLHLALALVIPRNGVPFERSWNITIAVIIIIITATVDASPVLNIVRPRSPFNT